MNVTMHIPASDRHEGIAFGSYVRDEVEHEVVAIRRHGDAWRLVDAVGDTATVIESFFADEQSDAVRAVAEQYLGEMRS